MRDIADFNLEQGFLSMDDKNNFKQISQSLLNLKKEHVNVVVYNENIFNAVYEKLKCVYRKNHREGKGLPKSGVTEEAGAEMEAMASNKKRKVGDVAEPGEAGGEDGEQQEGAARGERNSRGEMDQQDDFPLRVRVTHEKKLAHGKCSKK